MERDGVEEKLAYEAPELIRLGTIFELTRALPSGGVHKCDNSGTGGLSSGGGACA